MSDFKQFEQQDFTTDYLGDGVRYRLPRRQFGRLRHLGWLVALFGLFLTAFSIVWLTGTTAALRDQLNQGGLGLWMAIIFCCVGLFILFQGLIVLLGGIAVIRNRTRCEIEVRDGKIRVKERFSFFKLRRKRAAADIQRLRIVTSSEMTPGKQKHHATQAWLGDFEAALMADTGTKHKFPIAIAYPRELLVRLAEELAPRLEADLNFSSATIEREPTAAAAGEQIPRKIEVVEGADESDMVDIPDETPIAPVQPVGSTAMIERRPYGITIDIPPAGIWKGSKGLFVFALIWNAFISIFMVVAVLGAVGAVKVEGNAPPLMMLVFMIPFVAVGVGITIASINMGRRHATIATADDLVMVVRHSIFGKSTREWSAAELAAICVGNSGMEVNNVPVQELQIHPNDGNKFGCLSQLDDDELIWIAAELNQVLAIQRPSERDAR